MAERLAFTGKQEVQLETFTPQAVGPGDAGVKSLYSLMSTGTENIVFNRLFEEGGHWDEWVKYPFHPGYSIVGEVAELGANVTHLKIGDRVAMRRSHASYHVVDAGECYPVPPDVDTKDAAWFALAKITFHGAMAAGYKLGDSVLIIGAGPIGQLSLRWALAAGADPVIMVDPIAARMVFAPLDPSRCLALPADGCRREVGALTGVRMPKIVVDTTGNARVFSAALDLAGYGGKVVLMGDTGNPSEQRLSGAVLRNGLTITAAHDTHNSDEWNNGTITRLFFQFLSSGRMDMSGLNTHVFTPQDCVNAYATANEKRGETMGILFDWTGTEGISYGD